MIKSVYVLVAIILSFTVSFAKGTRTVANSTDSASTKNSTIISVAQDSSKISSSGSTSSFSDSYNNHKINIMIDIIGANRGYSNLSMDFKIEDKISALVLTGTQIIEEASKSYASTEVNGFLISRYFSGEFAKSAVIVGLGPLSVLHLDEKGNFTKNMAAGLQVSGQVYVKDRFLARLYMMGSTLSALNMLGLQVGFGF